MHAQELEPKTMSKKSKGILGRLSYCYSDTPLLATTRDPRLCAYTIKANAKAHYMLGQKFRSKTRPHKRPRYGSGTA